MKRSWPEATPVALEPWHYEGNPVSKPCETCLASGLTSPIALPCLHINFCSDSCLVSSAFLCRTAEQVQAERCREVPAGRASYMGDWENQRGRTVAHSLGRSMHRGLLREPRKGWENWLQAQQFPLWCTLCNPGFEGVDVGRTARIANRSMLKKPV